VLVRDEIYRTFIESPDGGVEFFHGYTYSGHPLASAAALGTLDTYAEEGLFDRANQLGAYFEDGVHSLRGLPNVIDCRNLQLIGAVELARAPARRARAGSRCTTARGTAACSCGRWGTRSPSVAADRGKAAPRHDVRCGRRGAPCCRLNRHRRMLDRRTARWR